MTSVTAHDYAWIRSSPLFRHALETGYTLTVVRGVTPDEESDFGVHDAKAAVLALAERLTGVRVTEEVLRDAEYHLGFVGEEPAEEWTGIVIDLTDAHGERLYKEVTREQVETAMARARADAAAPIVIPGPSSPAP